MVEFPLEKTPPRAEVMNVDKSFRTILEEYLEASPAAPSATFTPPVHVDVPTFVTLNRPRVKRVPLTSVRGYARETELSRARAIKARQPRPEPSTSLPNLVPADRADVTRLIELGGAALADGLSAGRLKAAYRALARRHHPDLNPVPGAHETFLEVRALYARLLARLPAYQTCSSR